MISNNNNKYQYQIKRKQSTKASKGLSSKASSRTFSSSGNLLDRSKFQPNENRESASNEPNKMGNTIIADHEQHKTTQVRYKCDQCNKTFKRKSNLKSHLKVHTDFAYICTYCNKKFARSGNLHQHVRIHTNEKPFSCKYCNKAYVNITIF